MTDTLSCGHPNAALEYGGSNPGDPVRCGWCRDLAETKQEANARAARVVRLFSEIAHERPGVDWGVDGAGIHDYTPNDPRGCPVCEALDAVLEDARATFDVLLTPAQRDSIARFKEAGLLWLVNTAVLHPRGYALYVTVAEDGTPVGMAVAGDGTEPWCFGDDAIESFHAHTATEQAREAQWTAKLKGDEE